MNSFKNYLQSSGKSKSTIERYNCFVFDFLTYLDRDNTEPENATAKEVLGYLNHLQQKGLENKTRNIRLLVIKQFFNYLIENGRLPANPVAHLKIRGIKHKKLYPILNGQELEQLMATYEIPTEEYPDAARNWFKTYQLSRRRNKAMISLLFNQGLTTAEVIRIEQTDLKLREGEIYISGSRTSNERTLLLKPGQIIDLMEYTLKTRQEILAYHSDKTIKNLFLPLPSLGKKASEAMTIGVFKNITKELQKSSEKFKNFKQVRTSVITKWLKQYNLREVQYMAGHRFVSSTESYMVNQTEDLQEAIDKFHPF